MSTKPRLNVDALIFSLYDVVVDAGRQMPDVICQTVQHYLEHAIGLAPSDRPLLTPADVTRLQKAGFFTDYLGLATALITYFIELLPPVPIPTFPSKYHVPAIIAYLQMAGGRLQIDINRLREQKDIDRLASDIAAAGGGMDGADAALPKANRHLLVVDGDITKTNLVGRVFQELYLGANLFEKVYGQPAVIVQAKGYAHQTSLLITPAILENLSQKIPLGLVANCSQTELDHLPGVNSLRPFFQSIITLDNVKQAGGWPVPHSWPLLEAARRLKPTPTHTAYITAGPQEIQAVKAANQTVPFTGIGCLAAATDKQAWQQEFEQRKADIILGHPDHLKELILG